MQTILAVDDEFGAIEVLAAALEDEGYRVIAAANGLHGLERLAETQVDLVIVDFMMPLLDGAGMARAMRENAAWRDVPIILMSAVAEPVVRERFDGYTAFLRKPFRASTLIALVKETLAAARD